MAQMTLPGWFKEAKGAPCPHGGTVGPQGYIENSLKRISKTLLEIYSLDALSARRGFLQAITPGARLAGFLLLMLASAITANGAFLAFVAVIALIIALDCGIRVRALILRTAPVAVFTLIMASPVFLSVVTPGKDIFVIYGALSVTYEGFLTGIFFVSRASLMVSLTAILLISTGQTGIFTGLRRLRAPVFLVTALFMTMRYMTILLKVAEDAALAQKSRVLGRVTTAGSRSWFSSRVAMLFGRSVNMAGEVSSAMRSRGFETAIKTMDAGAMKGADYAWIGVSLFVFFLSVGLLNG